MVGFAGVSLGLELTRILPIGEALQSAASRIISFARDLRNSGSDIVVEEDLASVFGRVRLDAQFEAVYRESVKDYKITPIHHGLPIALYSGPGPTMLRALTEDSKYLATVVQLSLLGWMHDRTQLATLITGAFAKRHEIGIPDAASDPGFDGIVKTLAACASQTSSFMWSYYVSEVESRMANSIPGYRFSPLYTRLTPAIFYGILDCLVLVQSLPENRSILISNQTGSITIVIWAHYVLGLHVVITIDGKVVVSFGRPENASIAIVWVPSERFHPTTLPSLRGEPEHTGPDPDIRLLDSDASILLHCFPDDEDRQLINARERHPLRGWGSTFLRRALNRDVFTPENDPIYRESVNLVTAMAARASQCAFRNWSHTSMPPKSHEERRSAKLEMWRIMDTAALVFDGIPIDDVGVRSMYEYTKVTPINEETLPNTFVGLKLSHHSTPQRPPLSELKRMVYQLTFVVFCFAHVVEISTCGDLPICVTEGRHLESYQLTQILEFRSDNEYFGCEDVFQYIGSLLKGPSFLMEEIDQVSDAVKKYLISDFGWSVHFNTVEDGDPADVRPELLHVKPGVPTNIRTKQRRQTMSDGAGFARRSHPASYPIFTGPTYVPRKAASVKSRKELIFTAERSFDVTILYSIEPSQEWREHESTQGSPVTSGVSNFEEVSGYHALQRQLWNAYRTPSGICEHHPFAPNPAPTSKLGPDACALMAYHVFDLSDEFSPQKTIVLLTCGEPQLRWLAVKSHQTLFGRDMAADQRLASIFPRLPSEEPVQRGSRHDGRYLMLRSLDCCNACALAYVSSLQGYWKLVL